jgi:hypothetical protein
LFPLEERLAPALTFPGLTGITFDSAGDVFVSYDSSTVFSGQQQSVAEVNASGFLVSASVFGTTGASAFPGSLTLVEPSDSLPNVASGTNILELQPNGQLFVFNPASGQSSQYDDLTNYSASASNVFNLQTGTSVNLSSQISFSNATYGDFGIYSDSLVIAAESNNWDFVMRLTYGATGAVATVLVASPASDGLSAAPEGVAVDSRGTVLATLPYKPPGSATATHEAVGFSLSFDTGGSPGPRVPNLGLSSIPSIDAGAITVDSQDNFILATTDSSLYGGGPGVVHINSALSAFLADPLSDPSEIPSGISYQNVGGTDRLAVADSASETYTTAGELPLFSGQASAAQLRHAYGIDQITFPGPGGTTVVGDGSGQTIAIVEEGVDPTLGADLATFDQFFGIPAPPSFRIVNQNGVTTENTDIIGEASLDVEWAHAVAPGASIVVYNAEFDPNNATASFQNLIIAMQQASRLPGVTVVTLSYGLPESSLAASGLSQQTLDANFTTPGVTFLVASGDSGIYGNGGRGVTADFPGSSANVVSVGGTSIVIDSAGDYPGTGSSGEVAWGTGTSSGSNGGGGGGLSAVEAEPAWQKAVVPASIDSINARALPDVAMDSGSAQEYDVFTSTVAASSVSPSAVGWLGDAGTSAASPIWAGLIAIADQGRALEGGSPLTGNTQTLPALYSLPSSDFHDIVFGNNGDPAEPGFDLTSGLGSPVANLLVPDLAGYQIPAKLTITSQPTQSIAAGAPFTLTVQVQDRMGNSVTGGTVTVAIGQNPASGILGGTLTVPVENGLATFSNLSLSQPGVGYTLTITGGGTSSPQTTNSITVTGTGKSAASLVLSNLNFTYDGSSHAVRVITSPTGLSGVTVSYTQNGVAVASPTLSGSYTVTATLTNPDYVAPSAIGTLAINKATPTISWSNPADIPAGSSLGSAQLDATASFEGSPLSGTFAYTPAAGTILSVGNSQVLKATFAPADGVDFASVQTSVTINVVSQPPPPVKVVLLGEQPIFDRKHKKNGNPLGKPFLVGFRLQFNTPLTSASASNAANYQLDIIKLKKVKNKLMRILQPIEGFAVSYSASSEAVILSTTGVGSFPNGGVLKVLPGVTGGSNGVLTGATSFKITPGAKSIRPT